MPIFSKKSETAQLDAPNTVIGKGIVIEAASMTGAESVRIDGVFNGNVDIDGSLVLGDSGVINGETRANYFVVAGEVTGNIACETVLHFASTARVFGDVETQSLIVDEGSQISGRYSVGERPGAEIPPYLERTREYLEDDER